MTELKIKNGIMKSVFITFDQAFYERILALLDRQNCRGFSYWQQLQGRGSVKERTALWQSRVAQYVLGHYDSGR